MKCLGLTRGNRISCRHITIVETLAKKNRGMNRNELCEAGSIQPNGHLTEVLAELEQCDFVEKFIDFTKKKTVRTITLRIRLHCFT